MNEDEGPRLRAALNDEHISVRSSLDGLQSQPTKPTGPPIDRLRRSAYYTV
jgi:hypothetical protein